MPLTPKQMLRMYKEAGWKIIRQTGSHIILGFGPRREVIPMHGKDLKIGLEKRLLKTLISTKEEE